MQITDELMNHLSKLSRLQFNASEREAMKKDLSKMIDFVDKLNELNLDGVSPLRQVTQNMNQTRADLATPKLPNSEALKNAAESTPPYFIVPKVLAR